ncbi:MAG: hypothetical protein NC213_04760 [Acetobacter sp.]|nr:hypothetical protein [Bacteroides sp.]MCM1341036.1 hypothetical protein [Acetobacter sp.]MCM1432408.1 hypothetical protein [Clostridiales bacterium]
MTGLIIYENQGSSYKGVATPCCLGDYCENSKIGDSVFQYIDQYIDFESQLIKLNSYSIYYAEALCQQFKKIGVDTGILIYCDVDEIPHESTDDFLGYDVCAEDYYTSPLGMEYLEFTSEDIEFMVDEEVSDDFPFFENISNEVRHEYEQQLNKHKLFDNLETAEEIAEYCNYLTAQYDNIFEGLKNFKIVKIYAKKS